MSNAPDTSNDAIETFISRWKDAEATERANYQMFLAELCELLAVAPPDPSGADNAFNQNVFDRAITRSKPDGSSTTVWADLYKCSCFILETKQGAHAPAATSVAMSSEYPLELLPLQLGYLNYDGIIIMEPTTTAIAALRL